ncbi:hypothetical protein GGR57DRAFT_517062 [Xylariaceae sp. FL1272]|nr:hypothetical protein GGR57DRAFT_517062 [Xylariaceae sp. FL1272]
MALEGYEVYFGFEHEAPMLFADDEGNQSFQDLKTTQWYLHQRLEQYGLDSYLDSTSHKKYYTRWCIATDPTMDPGKTKEKERIAIPIEIKSPILSLGNGAYRDPISRYWQAISLAMVRDIALYKLCATHFHFSIGSMTHVLEQTLAFAFIYFERDIDDIMPNMTHHGDRKREGGWKNCEQHAARLEARPGPGKYMRDGYESRDPVHDLKAIWKAIRSTKDHKELHTLVNYDTDNYRRANNMANKTFKVNFNGLEGQTIEFRQWYPARTEEQMLDMITFLGEFFGMAFNLDPAQLDRAADGQILFAEAVGFQVPKKEKNEYKTAESRWGNYKKRAEFDRRGLRSLMPVHWDDAFWGRLHLARDYMEQDLSALNPAPKESKKKKK